MGSYRKEEDDVYKISTLVFIMNFLESCSAMELFQSCKQYGHVVDIFIHNKWSKTRRRFGFVRFINIFNEERLVNNLCTVWIDHFKLHANIAWFHRTPLNEKKSMPKKLMELKRYREDSMKLFQVNVSIGSWFSQFKQASMEFNTKGRIAWVEVEGIPFKLWSDNTFKRIATKAFWIRAKEAPGWVPDFIEENDDEEHNDDGGFNVHESGSYGGDSDVEGVLETIFEESVQKENKLNEEHTDKSDNIVNLSDHNAEEVNNTFSGNCPKNNSKEDVSNSVSSGHYKTSMVPRMSRSILSLMDKLVKVGQVMRYKMDGCMSNMTEIIELKGVKEVNR
uniref:Nucleotide-binding alpha-beta plait domain-containing protein n=1 Tax=Tanacetum cinerariifolium TaxID=118510 RepID=A0A6L2LVB0_TANCI|nr:nucleotide-binding alpha-beta plait domain-containing protein [Tanacetum cinerariifolium]